MASDFTPDLPKNIPTEKIIVEDEEFRLKQYKTDSDDVVTKTEYEFEKAPIQRIEEVTGVHGGDVVEFKKNTDYKLSDDKERIVWLETGKNPEPGSFFYITYRSNSILGRFIESHTNELDKVQQDLNELTSAKFIGSADRDELEKIGSIFGTLGERRGRNEEQYRIYLKSIIKSFDSKGTENDIKTALAAATDIPLEDINIQEDFENTQYSISIEAATPITGSLIGTVADIADPSGVEQARTKLRIPRDITEMDDGSSFSTGERLSDTIVLTDGKRLNPNKFSITNTTGINDIGIQNQASTIEPVLQADTAKLNADKQTVPEQLPIKDKNVSRVNQIKEITGLSDSPNVEQIEIGWNSGDWDSLHWAGEQY